MPKNIEDNNKQNKSCCFSNSKFNKKKRATSMFLGKIPKKTRSLYDKSKTWIHLTQAVCCGLSCVRSLLHQIPHRLQVAHSYDIKASAQSITIIRGRGVDLQTCRKLQKGSAVRTFCCCLDNKRRICAQNKGGEREDLGVTISVEHPVISRYDCNTLRSNKWFQKDNTVKWLSIEQRGNLTATLLSTMYSK